MLLLLMLIGFEFVPGLSGGDASSMNQVSLQRTRSQILVNAVYQLAYRPVGEHAQAMDDLQTVLPAFEQEQTQLLTDPTTNVQYLLQQARTDYLPLVAAVQIISAHPHTIVDPLEINIIVLHERSYLTTMNNLLSILPQDFENRNIQLFVIQIVIEVVFLVVFFIVQITSAEKTPPPTSGKTKPWHTSFFVRELLVCVLVCVLVGLEIVPLGAGNQTEYLHQAVLQRTRCEQFANSALVLAYRPATEHPAALSDIQVILPLFQQEQAILLADTNADVHAQAQEARTEYQMMSTAVQTLAANPDAAVDPGLVTTIVSQTPGCLAVMGGIVLAVQHHMEQQATLIFSAEVAIETVLFLFFAALLLFSYDPSLPREQRKN